MTGRLLVLFGLALAFAGWRISGFALPEAAAEAEPPVVAALAETRAAPDPAPPVGAFDVVVERPLFRNTRAAPVTEAPAPRPVATPVVPEAKWRLIGFSRRGDDNVALLLPPDVSEPVRARVGDRIEALTVVAIEDGFVKLTGSGGQGDLTLYLD